MLPASNIQLERVCVLFFSFLSMLLLLLFFASFAVRRKNEILCVVVQNIQLYCIYKFLAQRRLPSFQILGLGFILKTLCLKFHPGYSYNTCSQKKGCKLKVGINFLFQVRAISDDVLVLGPDRRKYAALFSWLA